ncbi:MAG TPA: hypothetical protein VMG39_01880 [Pseudolabrys sp.]|nr:hypothetical protein [Pseudolabrys sp.]
MPNILMTRRALAAVTIALSLAATAAFAQQPGRIRGQIEKVDGGMMVLKTREGAMLNVKVDEKSRVTALVKASLGDIKPDTWIGIAGIPKPDGSIEAFSVHIPPAALRGQGEGVRPWDAKPGSTMTNAYFESAVTSADGNVLTVKNKDGEKKVIVTNSTVIAAAAPADKAELKPGAQIIIFGQEKQTDGTVLIKSMYVGRGVTPAM